MRVPSTSICKFLPNRPFPSLPVMSSGDSELWWMERPQD